MSGSFFVLNEKYNSLQGAINALETQIIDISGSYVTLGTPQTITGNKTFDGSLNAVTVDILDDSTSVATTEWVKDYIPIITGGFVTASANNTFTGINSFVNPVTPTTTTFDDISCNTITGDLSGNAVSATNIAGGASYEIPYQSATDTTLFITPNGVIGDVLYSGAGIQPPYWAALPPPPPPPPAETLGSVMANGNQASTTLDMNSQDITNGATVTATSFVGALTGNADTATTASTATNIAGGAIYEIPYQSATGTTSFITPNGNPGDYLASGEGIFPPYWAPLPAAPATPDLSIVLAQGNSAGLYSINMNSQDITNGATFTATSFVGALTGNADTATDAANATDITITDSTATVGTFYPTFVNGAGTQKTVRLDTGFSYIPSTDTLTVTNISGTVTHALDITVTDTTSTVGTFYPTFVNTTGTQKSIRADTSGLTYTPSSNTLTTTNFAGNASSATTATASTNLTGGAAGSIPYQSAAATTAFLAAGTAGQVLTSQGSSAPTWTTSTGLPASPATTGLKYLLFNAGTGGNAWDDIWDTTFNNVSLFSAYNPLGSSSPSKTQNMAIGVFALNNLTGAGINNLAVGQGALSATGTTTFNNVTAIGYNAGNSWGSGKSGDCNNVFVGNGAGGFSSGINCVYIGGRQVAQSASGNNNVIVGGNALGGGGPGTGGQNTMVGMNTGLDIFSGTATGSNNTYIGYQAGQSPALPTSQANTVVLGNGSVATFRCQVALTVVSDERDKKDFVPLDAGLDFVNELKPVRFEWNNREGGLEGRKDVGFTAQSLQQTQATTGLEIPNLVNDDCPDKLSIMPTQLIPILVKAVQELSAEVKLLKEQIKSLSV
jgi:hypothetical protein